MTRVLTARLDGDRVVAHPPPQSEMHRARGRRRLYLGPTGTDCERR
jgi:hypothetical protein